MQKATEENPTERMYCTGCNELFAAANVCPRCGQEPGSTNGLDLDDTMLMTRIGDIESDTDLTNKDLSTLDLAGKGLGVYDCQTLIGSGGMGLVYLARHKRLERECALKVLSPQSISRDIDYVQRFMHEGQSAAALIHPNIVTIHAIGEEDGLHYLEMEYVPGRSLQSLIDDEGALAADRATSLVASIADGLAAAHQRGIVHRDLKPDNVLMTANGIPKIADFGLAKRVVADQGKRYLAGTPNFMAPEVYQGEGATPASDVYSLGVCYFLLLTGKLPYHGNSFPDLMHAVLTDPIPSARRYNRAVTLEMAEALNLLLSKGPSTRPRDAFAAAHLLRAVLGSVRDVESLLYEAFEQENRIAWQRDGECYTVHLKFRNGRGQKVFVETSGHSASERLLMIYSVCCKAEPGYYEAALRMNSGMLHGATALRDIDGVPHFVTVDTYPRGTVNAEEIRRSVWEVGIHADDIERKLTGLDVN